MFSCGHNTQNTVIGFHHSVTLLYKGDQLFLWKMAKLGVSEFQNPWIDSTKCGMGD